jgi:hypothetical protein
MIWLHQYAAEEGLFLAELRTYRGKISYRKDSADRSIAELSH